MPRGGRRSGKPGEAYANRSDLASQPVRTAPGQIYGVAGAQRAAQQAIPLPQSPPVQASPASAVPPIAAPPEPGMLHAPSARPGEPVTAGLPVGAGPGPEALAQNSVSTNAINDIRTLYRMFPVEEVRQVLERFEGQRGLS